MTTTTARGTRLQMHPLKRRVLTVTRTEQLTPTMRRVFLGGEDLEADFPFAPMATGDHVKLFFPDPQTGELTVPEIGPKGFAREPGGPELIFRDYTVLSIDREIPELAVDFVLHDHGVAGRWAGQAEPGAQLGVLGPRGSVHYPADYAWYLIGGDETALPAIARWIAELPATARVTAVISIASEEERQSLAGEADHDIRWVVRDLVAPDAWQQAIRAVALPADDDYYVWLAGEAGTLAPVRRYFRDEVGLPRDRYSIDGYWKQGVVNLDHHASDDE